MLGFPPFADSRDLEGLVLHVALDLGVLKLATNKSLGIKNSVGRVHSRLVLRSISNETLFGREGDVGRCGTVTLWWKVRLMALRDVHGLTVIGDDLYAVELPYADAA